MDPYDFILEKVTAAGGMVMRLREETFEKSIKENDPRNIVTSVDIAVSEFLTEEIKKAFPGQAIYSEEKEAAFDAANEFLWTIDPIDGTQNFSRGIPHFSVVMALLHNGVPVAGAVYNPVVNELYSFKKGGGAYLNSKSIHVSAITELSKAHVFLHAGRKREHWDWGGASYRTLLEHANKTSNFSGSALDICFVAAGRIEAVVYGGLAGADVAAAVGILEEAGGVACDGDGKPIVFTPESRRFFAANNKEILAQLRALI
jgi:myo-inositol-1(or 4)-monophosphatase